MFAGSRDKDVTTGSAWKEKACLPLNTAFFRELTCFCKTYQFQSTNNGGLFNQKLWALCRK